MIKNMIGYVRRARDARRLYRVYEKYRHFTMIPPSAYVANLALVRGAAGVPGAVVECGVWRGGMIAGMADVLGPDREYVLCDSFEGLPPVRPIDGPAAARWQQETGSPDYHNNCAASIDDARVAMSQSGATRVTYVAGWFDQTLTALQLAGPVAVLRLDGDWYDSTITCLRHLAPRVHPGGLILVDDYYAWDGCSKAVHDYLAEQKSTWRVRQYRDQVCYIRADRDES